MRVLLLGCTETTRHAMRAVLDAGQEIAALCTIARQFDISYSDKPVTVARYIDSAEAGKAGVRTILVGRDIRESINELKALKPDMILVVGWYYMVPPVLRRLAPLGCLGMHASLLPRYAGGAPLNWAIINGERETGLTLFHLEDGVDTGDIVSQKRIPIAFDDNIATVYRKVDEACYNVLVEVLPQIAAGRSPRRPQDFSDRSVFPQRSPEDGRIDWTKSALDIYNFVRAQSEPYPGAFTYLTKRKVTVWETKIFDFAADRPPPGTVMEKKESGGVRGILVATGDVPILITRHRLSEGLEEREINAGGVFG